MGARRHSFPNEEARGWSAARCERGGSFYCDFGGVHGLPGLAADNHMVARNCERCRVLLCAFGSFDRRLMLRE
jgi:hypothetical protein